jgi:gluconolactonase
MSAVSNFTLSADDFSVYGHGLLRPECVWADSDGVWVSDARGGVSHIGENGNARLLGDGIIEANGFSRRRNGTFVVAGLGDGMVHEVNPNGET